MGAEDEAAKAVAALTREASGLDKAAGQAASAAAHAGRSVGQAQQAGFARVAEGVAQLQGRIEKLAAILQTAVGQVEPAQSAAAEATGQADPEQAIARLTATLPAVDSAHTAISGAVQEARSLEGQVAQVLRGAQPGPLTAMLQSVRETATAAGNEGRAAKRHVEAGIALGQQIAGGGTGN